MFDPETKDNPLGHGILYHVTKLVFGSIEVMVPQGEVLSVESVYELSPRSNDKKHIGVIYKKKTRIPVYCFSDSMEILRQAPEDRSKCVVIRHDEGDFSILCHDIKNVVLSDMRLQAVPACMNSRKMPLSHLCLYKESSSLLTLGLVTNAACLNGYINNV